MSPYRKIVKFDDLLHIKWSHYQKIVKFDEFCLNIVKFDDFPHLCKYMSVTQEIAKFDEFC